MEIFKNAKFNLLTKLLIITLFSALIFLWIFFSIVGGESKFNVTYQSVIQRKYEKLTNEKDPKIIIIGGSNAGFGFDSKLLEEKTGYPVVNMGLHAGFGNLFNTEIARNNIKNNDIVILAYEYGITSATFNSLGDVKLIMSGIDNNLEIYKEIPLKNMLEIFGSMLSYAEYKAQKDPVATGVYGSESFDEEGNMIYKRSSYTIKDYHENTSQYGAVYGQSLLAENDNLEYLQDFKKYVEKQGASIYFTSAVLLKDAYHGTEENLLNYARELEQRTGIKYISNPYDYLFDSEYMYDTIYHCNDMGELKRTELFITDLEKNSILH